MGKYLTENSQKVGNIYRGRIVSAQKKIQTYLTILLKKTGQKIYDSITQRTSHNREERIFTKERKDIYKRGALETIQ